MKPLSRNRIEHYFSDLDNTYRVASTTVNRTRSEQMSHWNREDQRFEALVDRRALAGHAASLVASLVLSAVSLALLGLGGAMLMGMPFDIPLYAWLIGLGATGATLGALAAYSSSMGLIAKNEESYLRSNA